MGDNDNEGSPGFRIDQVEGKAKLSVPGLKPNLITNNAGTNDCAQNFDVDNSSKRMGDMLDTEARVLRVNQQFRALAKQKAAEKKRIVLVDMHGPDGPQKGDMADSTHPDDFG
ncbi:Uncharacterized protein TCAP_02740 [Tolypocladium capitatum]|uniref:Uncharacterized protein n=1 Tax=Tolypocladium capitatum TaxID=45235 RepID=A0A2K3QIH7_9HYPO|nr:Uncharacterized protein TCAP_02740 [Tolypocladium capitatum]